MHKQMDRYTLWLGVWMKSERQWSGMSLDRVFSHVGASHVFQYHSARVRQGRKGDVE